MKLIEENVLYEQSAITTIYDGEVSEFRFNWHCHDEFEISLILKGKGIRYTGDCIENFMGPEMIWVPSRLPHTWQSDKSREPSECIVLQFRKDFLGRHINTLDTSSLALLFADTRARKFDLSPDLIQQARAVHDATGIPRLTAFLSFLETLRDTSFSFASHSSPQMMNDEGNRLFQRISAYIQCHIQFPISIPDVAHHCAMSESTFRRFFRRATGHSFVRYINAMRISKACELLTDEQHSVTEICYLAGFSNLTFFNRKFKELKHMTPREFRQRHRRPSS